MSELFSDNTCPFIQINVIKEVENDKKDDIEEKFIQLDMREHGLIKELKKPFSTYALDVGDIWIGKKDKPALILERKTAADFSSSVTDGRYREQRGRLLAYSQELGSKIAYVIEGSLNCRLGEQALIKLIARLQLVHGIPVFRTQSLNDTSRFIENMYEYWKNDNKCFESAVTAQRAVDGIHIKKKDNTNDTHMFAVNVICQVPGVSVKIAEGWLSEFGSLKAVLTASEEKLAAVKIAGRKNPAAAKKLCSMWKDFQVI
jgi:ERCC4-type nuclease